MKIKNFQAILLSLIIIPLMAVMFITIPVSYAQSSSIWSDPIDLSNSGSSANPTIVVDAAGTIHVIWVDEFDGYRYTESKDGVTWTAPKNVKLPLSPKDDSQPLFFASPTGSIYAFWQDQENSLFYSSVLPELDVPASWQGTTKLAESVIGFGVDVDAQGTAHVGYASGLDTNDHPAGVYYLQLNGAVRSPAINLYSSRYFRSLKPGGTSVHTAVAENNKVKTVYMVWDDRLQRQIMLANSLDGGKAWQGPVKIQASEDISGTPYNINVSTADNKVLLLWQSGAPGSQCSQFSQVSIDGAQQFASPIRIGDEATGCPKASDLILLNKDFSVVWLNVYDYISLAAWNGTSWSKPQSQDELTTFTNPETLDSVIFGCQNKSVYNGQLFVVGCDKGSGGDIWFTSRSLGTIADWFPASEVWTAPAEVTSSNRQLSELSSASDLENNVHLLWVQPSLPEKGVASVQYAGWDGQTWSKPIDIFTGLDGYPIQLKVKTDHQKRLLLAWVNSKTGDMFLSWVEANRAQTATEWATPQYIPSPSQANSSPDILVDDSGRIIVTYAIPINEERGIYFVESDDGGITWTQPIRVFDAASAGWEVVDQPEMALTSDGRLHVLFRRYPFKGNSPQPVGLYYSQSSDGGATWSDAEIVSKKPVLWSDIVGDGPSTLHRFWQENSQSMLVSFDQISQDSGVTWGSPMIVSNVDSTNLLTAEAIDGAGNLHFLQVTSKEKTINLDQRIWNGSSWVSEDSNELYLRDPAAPSSITAAISSKGNLWVSILMNYPYLTDNFKSSIIGFGKSLDLPETPQALSPVIVPAVKPTAVNSDAGTENLQSPTAISPLADLGDTPSFFSKNLVGFLVLGGVLILVAVLFRPGSRKQADRKKGSATK